MEKSFIAVPDALLTSYSDEFKSDSEKVLHELNEGGDFAIINRTLASSIAPKSAFLLSIDLGQMGNEDKLSKIFFKFCLECGSKFENAKKGDPKYAEAKSAVGKLALKYLPDALEAIGNNTNIGELIDKVDFLMFVIFLQKNFQEYHKV